MKLLPCPFCGTPDPELSHHMVECVGCGGAMSHDTARKAANAWNKRQPPLQHGVATAQLRKDQPQ